MHSVPIIMRLAAFFIGLKAQSNNVRCPERLFFDYGAKSFTVICKYEFLKSSSIIWIFNTTEFVAKLEGEEKAIYNEGQYDITRNGSLILLDPQSQEGFYTITTEHGEDSTIVKGREQVVTTSPRREDIFTTQHKPAADTSSPGVVVFIIIVVIAMFIVSTVISVRLLRRKKYVPVSTGILLLDTQPNINARKIQKTNIKEDEAKKILDDLQTDFAKKLIKSEEYLDMLQTELYNGRISEDQYLESLKNVLSGKEIKSNGFLDSLFHNCYVGKLNSDKYLRELEDAEKHQYISKQDLILEISRAHVGILISQDQFCKAFTNANCGKEDVLPAKDTTDEDNRQILEKAKTFIRQIDRDLATQVTSVESINFHWNGLWNDFLKQRITSDFYVKQLKDTKRKEFFLLYLKHLRTAFYKDVYYEEDFKEELDWALTNSLIDKKLYVIELRRSLLDSKISEESFTKWMNSFERGGYQANQSSTNNV